MVEKVLDVSSQSITTSLRIAEKNVLAHQGLFSESGLVENIAQTAAALSGCMARLNNEKVKLGFIGSVKNLVVHSLPQVGSQIETTVVVTDKVMNVDIIKGVVVQDGKTVAECEMKIFLED